MRELGALTNVSVFTTLSDTCSRLVETKQGVASSNAVKHNGFDTFLLQDDLELPWPPQPPRCLPDTTQMPPRDSTAGIAEQ